MTERQHVVLLDPSGFSVYRGPDGRAYLDPTAYEVTLVAKPGVRIGARAGEVERVLHVDAADVDAVLSLVPDLRRLARVDRVIALPEFTLLPAAQLREALGVAGPTVEQVTLVRDKTAMKRHFAGSGVRMPRHLPIHRPLDAADLLQECARIVVKPVDEAGSRGVHFIQNLTELRDLDRRGQLPFGRYQAEEFIDGPVHHIDSLVRAGQAVVASVSQFIDSNSVFRLGGQCRSVELAPGPANDELLRANREILARLPWFTGVTHLELFLDPDGGAVFCEIAGRAGGGGIVPAFRHRFGVDLRQASIAAQLGHPLPEPDPHAPGAHGLTGEAMIYAPRPGPMAAYGSPPQADWLLAAVLKHRPGDLLEAPRWYADGIAAIAVSGSDPVTVTERLDAVQAALTAPMRAEAQVQERNVLRHQRSHDVQTNETTTDPAGPLDWTFETQQIHAGNVSESGTGARSVPIYQTGAYAFQDVAHAARLFSLEEPGFIYSRVQNPTNAALESRLTALEGALEAVVFASGQAAITTTILNIARSGDHLVSSAALHGGTYNLLNNTLPDYGITTTFVTDPDDLGAWKDAIRPETKLVLGETVGNPRNNLLDVRAIAEVAHAAGLPLLIDNTALTPFLLRPLEHGADLVVHSTSKYLSGHGSLIGGVLLDGGSFDLGARPEAYPQFNQPDASFHGLVFWKEYGPGAFAKRLRARLMRDMGPTAAPMSSFLTLQGLETLSLRMERHVSNATALAGWLESQPGVKAVYYPGLVSSPWYALAQRYLPKGAGGLFSVDLEGGVEAGSAFVNALELIGHMTNLGDTRTLVSHPASTTHYQLDERERLSAGVTPGLVRVSTGLEGISDLKADIARGLRAAAGVTR